MFSKVWSGSAVSVLGFVLAISVGIGLSGNIALAENPPGFPDLPDACGDNFEFTTDFRIEDCKFINKGENPFFILKPGYQLVLESEDERSVETVLYETKEIDLDDRTIVTRVVEERAYEWDEDEGDWKTIEISTNWFAICEKTNSVFYFGEWSRDCEEGFDENDECEGKESNAGSWEAGVDGAEPGIMMPGTILLGARYFQEVAPPVAADRGEIVEMGLDWSNQEEDFTGCIQTFDTNPTDSEACGDDDAKVYCPGIGLVQDQELKLTFHDFVGGGDDDDDDDDDHKRWRRRHHRWH